MGTSPAGLLRHPCHGIPTPRGLFPPWKAPRPLLKTLKLSPVLPSPRDGHQTSPCFAELHSGTQNCSVLTQDKTGLLRLCYFHSFGFTFLKEPHQKLSGKMKAHQLIPNPSQPPKNLGRFEKVTMGRWRRVWLSQSSPKIPLKSMQSHEQENSLQGQRRFSP